MQHSGMKETQIDSVPAETALAQAMQVEPSRGQIPADHDLLSPYIHYTDSGNRKETS
jgi:hypothetical protein